MPTFNHFRGDAQGTAQVDTFTAASAEIGDGFTITINSKDVSYTLTQEDIDSNSSQVTKAQVVHVKLGALLIASEIPEFDEVTWSVTSQDDDDDGFAEAINIKATGPDDGTPFTATTATTDSIPILVETVGEGSPAKNEKQLITLPGPPTSGTWTLTFQGQTTAALAYDITAAALTTAVNLLSNVTSGDLVITGDAGGPWTVEFAQNYAATDVAKMTGSGTSLDGGQSVNVTTTVAGGGAGNEVQQLEAVATGTCTITATHPITTTQFQVVLDGNDTAADIQAAFAARNIDVLVTLQTGTDGLPGATYYVEFNGTWQGADVSGTDIALMTSSDVTVFIVTAVTEGGAAATGETQVVTLFGGADGGTFTLSFDGQTTSALTWDESAADVETALEALSTITAVTVTGSDGGPWTVVFVTPAGDVSLMTGDASNLTGHSVVVSTSQVAVAGVNEQQKVTIQGTPTGGTFTLTANPIGGGDETTSGIAYNAAASAVASALDAPAAWTSGDASVTGADGGPWTVEHKGTWAATNVAEMEGDGSSLTGGGTQTLTKASVTTPTGKHHFDNAENWSAGTAPATDEVLVFENSDTAIKYGLGNGTISPEALQFKASFTGGIGLPDNNPLGYREYRATQLRIGVDGTGTNAWQDIEIGQGDGVGAALYRFDTGDKETRFLIEHTANSADNVTPAVMIVNDNSATADLSTIDLYRGSVGVAFYEDETGTFTTINQAHRGTVATDTTLHLGDRATLTTLLKTGGEAFVSTGLSGDTMTSITNRAGILELYGEGDLSALHVEGGEVISKTTGVIGGYGAITGITAADPAVVTSTAHGLSDGDIVEISGVVGMTEINQLRSSIEVVDANSFQMVETDASGFTAYGSVGEWSLVASVTVSREGSLDFSQSLAARVVAPPIQIFGDDAVVTWPRGKLTTKSRKSGEFALNYKKTKANDGFIVYSEDS